MLRIGITKPCGENWAAFPKVREGFVLKGHCAACNKHVIDFTTWSEERIKDYFKELPQNVCGRVRPEQLRDYPLQKKQKKHFQYFYGLLLTALLSFTSKLTEAQVPNKPFNVIPWGHPKSKSNQHTGTDIVVKGKVLAAYDSMALPGISIVQKRTTNGTVTGIDGSFQLAINSTADSVTLIFSFIGLKTVETKVSTQSATQVNIVMEEDLHQITEAVWTGAIGYRTISPRRWWWNFKDLFRRF